jgi:Fic family protein
MASLFNFLKSDREIHDFVKASVFHYELEFIHPFADGNGRMGRLWQQLILTQESPLFQYIPVEALIKRHQADYYKVLAQCDQAGESTQFIEFSLQLIHEALEAYQTEAHPTVTDAPSRLAYARNQLSAEWFSRKDYITLYKEISSATASRDLLLGVDKGVSQEQGKKDT